MRNKGFGQGKDVPGKLRTQIRVLGISWHPQNKSITYCLLHILIEKPKVEAGQHIKIRWLKINQKKKKKKQESRD